MNMFHNMSLYRCPCGVNKATITSADGGDEITPNFRTTRTRSREYESVALVPTIVPELRRDDNMILLLCSTVVLGRTP